MEYSKTYVAKDEHVDVQEIMDGLYYDYIREILGFDFEIEAGNGIFMVLSNYSFSSVGSLKSGDQFKVTCTLYKDKGGLPKLHFKQTIVCNNKLMTQAVFTGTCVAATGGRPFLPPSVLEVIKDAPVLEN